MLKSIGSLLGIFLFVALLSQYTDFDLFFSDLFFNTNQNQFILQGENKSLGIMLHDYPKYLFMLFAISIWLSIVTSGLFKKNFYQNYFSIRDLLFISIASILIPAAIWWSRELSAMHCPRELVIYGGESLYLRILDSIPVNWENGQCSPSAHASSFIWVLSLLIVKKMKKQTWMFAYLMIFILSSVQIMRGAHFVSHIIYSIIIGLIILTVLKMSFYSKNNKF